MLPSVIPSKFLECAELDQVSGVGSLRWPVVLYYQQTNVLLTLSLSHQHGFCVIPCALANQLNAFPSL